MNKIAPVYYLLILFVISVLVRLPHIDRPLSSRYEWVTAHTLVTLNIWMEEGITNHNFNPIYTFTNPNDHHIKCPISGVSDEEGNYYYVSYPPLAFILPFILFKLTHLPLSALTLESFNVVLHFLCSLLIFFIIRNLYRSNTGERAALAGALVYIFATPNLWYHANVYFSDILVQLFFLLSILFYLKNTSQENRQLAHLLLACMSVFLMVYTEWLGLLAGGILCLHALFIRKDIKVSFLIGLSCASAISLFVIQYSSIAGMDSYIDTLLHRYAERSGNSGPVSIFDGGAHIKFLTMYLRNFFPFFILIFFGLACLLISKKRNPRQSNRTELMVLALAGIPVLLHHYLLFQFTIVHELSLVKGTVPISLIVAFLSYRVLNRTDVPEMTVLRYLYCIVFAGMLCMSTYFYYTHILKPGEYLSLRLGTQIKETSTPDDTIFFKTTKTLGGSMIKAPKNFVMAPQFQYYSGRCIQVVPHENEAVSHLKEFNKKQGIIYTIENSLYKVESVRRVYNPDYTDNPQNIVNPDLNNSSSLP